MVLSSPDKSSNFMTLIKFDGLIAGNIYHFNITHIPISIVLIFLGKYLKLVEIIEI